MIQDRMSATTIFDVLRCGLLTYVYVDFYRHSRLPPGQRGIPLISNLTIIPQKDEMKGTSICDCLIHQLCSCMESKLLASSLTREHLYIQRPFLQRRQTCRSDCKLHLYLFITRIRRVGELDTFGNRFKAERQLMSQSLSRRAVARWEPYLHEEVQSLLKNLLSMPDQFVGNAQRCVPNVLRLNCFYLNIEHYRRMVGSLIFRTTYGYRVEKINDLYVNAAQDFMNIFIHAMIGDSKDTPKAQISFWGNMLPETTHDKEKEHLTKWIAASVYAAGSIRLLPKKIKQSVASITQLILAMVLHPGTPSSAGTDSPRSPIDLTCHVSVSAVISHDYHEHLFAVAPCSSATSTHARCCLRRVCDTQRNLGKSNNLGIRLLLNVTFSYTSASVTYDSENAIYRAILHDERIHDSPHQFRPERYLNLPDEETKRLLDPYTYIFGFDRRRCPGMDFADPSLWITTVMILSCFQILHARDEHGKLIEVKAAYRSGAIRETKQTYRHLEPFKCKIEPRHERITQLINDDWLLGKN
ncbi:LOW QUALITY PROTEIN: hypothetical protein CVT25_005922 [Psilocybe cyanescens]|uniref:Cytochrome P450 n=1 Tax=Psilocybe cyanescens TaxID=93625 RepID=A0A409VSS7_PSICY|nr:LOW QUALITY PROTEIN: hypothetical protein CVT25_005922 [Psilocybe cyanescens]